MFFGIVPFTVWSAKLYQLQIMIEVQVLSPQGKIIVLCSWEYTLLSVAFHPGVLKWIPANCLSDHETQ